MSMIAFYSAASGMKAFQGSMDVTAHNMANVNTNGYKARRPVFEELLNNRINTNVEGEHLVGHGVRQESVDQMMQGGSITMTDYPLDFAIVGDGFFEVDDGTGVRQFTRNGNFDLSIEGTTGTLTTVPDGAFVLDKNGQKITLTVNADGSFNKDDLIGRMGVFGFANQYGLNPHNGSRFTASETSGQPVAVPAGSGSKGTYAIRQGALEASGVNLSDEMARVISSQRAFQLNARVLQTADSMADTVNNLR